MHTTVQTPLESYYPITSPVVVAQTATFQSLVGTPKKWVYPKRTNAASLNRESDGRKFEKFKKWARMPINRMRITE